MRTWIVYVWDLLRDKLWFLPSLFSLAGLLAAIVTLNIDRSLGFGTESLMPSLETTGPAARTVLGSLIGALVTVAGLVFSLTMLSVSQTASQYGPRLIRSVFDRNVAQSTLGFFLGTIVYSMLVLRTIRDVESGGSFFTPNLSILIAELAGAGCVFSLLTFTNHMARCMRAETLIEGIYEDLQTTAKKLFPEVNSDEVDIEMVEDDAWRPLQNGQTLRSKSVGYLQAVDLKTIVHTAEKHGHRVEIEHKPGDFIHERDILAHVELAPGDDPEEWESLRDDYEATFLLGVVRTPRQDIEAGVLELVEAGVRALSPGINDPTTAINVIDYLSSLLEQLARSQWPHRLLNDKAGEPRVHTPIATFAGILNCGYDQMRQHAGSSVAVHCRLLEGLATVARSVSGNQDRQAIRRQAEMILRHAEREVEESNDVDDIRNRYQQVIEVLASSR